MIDIRMVGVPEHSNLPFHWVRETGADQAAGVRLHWQDVPEGTGEMVRMLRDGRADVGVLLTEGALAAALSNAGIRLWRLWSDAPLRWGVHVHTLAGFTHDGQLRGARFARSRPGSGSHLMALVGARARGWDPDALRFVDVGTLEGAREALAGNEADAFLWQTFTTKPVVDRGEWRRIGEWLTPWPSFVFAFADGRAADMAPAMERLLAALAQAASRMHTAPARQEISERYGQRPDDVAQWLGGMSWAPGAPLGEEMLQGVRRALVDAGALSASAPPVSAGVCG